MHLFIYFSISSPTQCIVKEIVPQPLQICKKKSWNWVYSEFLHCILFTDYYIRREENVQVDGGEVIKCWIYVLPKFKPEMLELDYLKDYHSVGDHGKPYDTEEEAYSVDDLDS